MITIKIPITNDSANTYPRDTLDFCRSGEKIWITLEDREVAISIDDFNDAVKALLDIED